MSEPERRSREASWRRPSGGVVVSFGRRYDGRRPAHFSEQQTAIVLLGFKILALSV